MKKRNMTAEDLLKLKFIRSVRLSPDESKIMFTAEVASEDKKKYHSHIYMMNADGTGQRQYTFGKVSDTDPVFSPDGKWIVFTSKRNDKKGIYKMPTAGGEPKLVVGEDGSYSEIAISPDSKKILCVFTKADDVPKDKDGKKESPVYRHITRMFYKLDNSGFMTKEPGHIYIYDLETGDGKQITRGRNGERCPTWLGSGKSIAYVSNVRRDHDYNPFYDDIFVIPSTGGKPRKLNKPGGPIENIAASPDGKTIAFAGNDNPQDEWGVEPLHIWKVPTRGGKAVDLTPKLDRFASDVTISDSAEVHGGMKPIWSSDGREIYFQVSENGSTRLYKIRPSGRGYTKVIAGKMHLISASLAGKNNLFASIISYSSSPAEIFVSNTKSGSRLKQVTQLNSEITKKVSIRKPEEMIVRGHDGYPIHTWIVKPPNFSAKRKYPSIMQIHGGPRVQYGHTFFHEMQYLAACGFVVYYCNPRGGQGYGKAHAEIIANNWGTYDYEDCMSVARFMAGKKYINKNRMGVTGGSYGGYMTNWIVSHTDFFKAAVTQRSVTNFISFYGSSDIGFDLDREIKGSPWKNHDSWWEMSPIKHVARIKTPLLIIHSENDLRCPIEQAEQLYISLKKLRRKTEMVRFPEEPHGLSRCGRPDRRIARLEWIRKWFDRYLKGKKV
jgi:dipeptidyl aminopeptidase/acylaminoacyl peptidase